MSDEYFKSTEYIRYTFCSDDGMYYPEEEETFDNWLAEVKAEAWEEGYTQGNNDMYNGHEPTANPYRQQT